MSKYSNSIEFLDKSVNVIIDRTLGSIHPELGIIYPLNYGFIPNTKSPDGEELDAYILGIFEPISEFRGKCIAVLQRKNDDDDKLIVVPEGKDYSNEQISALVEFVERYFDYTIFRD